MSINLNRLVLNTIKKNKLFLFGNILLIIGFIIEQLIFPKFYSDFIVELPGSINFKDIIIALLPFIIGQVFFYISNNIQSDAIPKMEMSVINEIIGQTFKSLKETKKKS